MAEDSALYLTNSYTNPVYPHSFPDPYILKFCGEYFAYCTGFWTDGKVFGVLRSRDLVNWQEIGGAMQPLESHAPFYWAPEVTYDNGKFYLYYSAGNEELMELRVAVSESPSNGFIDSGKRLTTEDFAIDPHVFTDDDGKRYLFYATDFLEHTHIGTGTVVDEMSDHYTLAGNPHPVTRARYDWQIYDPERKEKGGVRWHTVEGPFVVKHKGLYYEMFSGGNWKNVSYGVSFAVTNDIRSDQEWRQFCDGEKVLPILRTMPGLVTGPGHNSVVRGPNNRELYCIYHRWVEAERVLAIDRMDFAGKDIFVNGATTTPQTAPFPPSCEDFFESESLSDRWQKTGRWSLAGGQAMSEVSGENELTYQQDSDHFLCEFSLRSLEAPHENSCFGFCLRNEAEKTLEFLIFPNKRQVEIIIFEKDKERKQVLDLPPEFVLNSFHLLRVEVNGTWVKILLDENIVRFEKLLEKAPAGISLRAVYIKAAFSGFALTKGFEDLFEFSQAEPEQCGWQKLPDTGAWRIQGQELFLSSQDGSETIVSKGAFHKDYEFAANIRLIGSQDKNSAFGFLLLKNESEIISRFSIGWEGAYIYLLTGDKQTKFPLSEEFSLKDHHQFRFLCLKDRVSLQLDKIVLGEFSLEGEETKIAIFCQNSIIALDMARLTILQ